MRVFGRFVLTDFYVKIFWRKFGGNKQKQILCRIEENARLTAHDRHTNRYAGNKQDKKQESFGWNHMGKNTNHGSNKNQDNNKKKK